MVPLHMHRGPRRQAADVSQTALGVLEASKHVMGTTGTMSSAEYKIMLAYCCQGRVTVLLSHSGADSRFLRSVDHWVGL